MNHVLWSKNSDEWETPLDYQIALDMAINALKGNEMLAKEMTNDGNITTG